jgi:hypothetical protein
MSEEVAEDVSEEMSERVSEKVMKIGRMRHINVRRELNE